MKEITEVWLPTREIASRVVWSVFQRDGLWSRLSGQWSGHPVPLERLCATKATMCAQPDKALQWSLSRLSRLSLSCLNLRHWHLQRVQRPNLRCSHPGHCRIMRQSSFPSCVTSCSIVGGIYFGASFSRHACTYCSQHQYDDSETLFVGVAQCTLLSSKLKILKTLATSCSNPVFP